MAKIDYDTAGLKLNRSELGVIIDCLDETRRNKIRANAIENKQLAKQLEELSTRLDEFFGWLDNKGPLVSLKPCYSNWFEGPPIK